MYVYLVLISLLSLIYGIYIYRYNIVKYLIRILFPHIKNNSNIPASEIIGNVIKINYLYEGNIYSVYLPYKKARRGATKYYLLDENNKETNITQQFGVKYYVSAKDLGGKQIISKNFDQILQEYPEEEIPQ